MILFLVACGVVNTTTPVTLTHSYEICVWKRDEWTKLIRFSSWLCFYYIYCIIMYTMHTYIQLEMVWKETLSTLRVRKKIPGIHTHAPHIHLHTQGERARNTNCCRTDNAVLSMPAYFVYYIYMYTYYMLTTNKTLSHNHRRKICDGEWEWLVQPNKSYFLLYWFSHFISTFAFELYRIASRGWTN